MGRGGEVVWIRGRDLMWCRYSSPVCGILIITCIEYQWLFWAFLSFFLGLPSAFLEVLSPKKHCLVRNNTKNKHISSCFIYNKIYIFYFIEDRSKWQQLERRKFCWMYLVALKDDIKWNPVHMDTKETSRSVHIKRALKKNHPGQMYNWYKG